MRGEQLKEAERALKARVHRQMGMTAAVMGVIAAGVGFWWINRVFGVSPLEALVSAMPLFAIVVALLGLTALAGLGAARMAISAERLARRSPRAGQTDE